MKWEVASDIFKALLILAATWVARYFAKVFLPFTKAIRKIAKVSDRVDELENKVFILDSKLAAGFHTAVDPVFIVDLKGDLIYANPAWQDFTEFSNVKDAYGKGYLRAIPPDDRDSIEEQSERLLLHPGSIEMNVRFLTIRTKIIVNTLCRSEPFKNKEGIVVGTLGRLKILK